MINYKEEFKKISHHIFDDDYNSVISKSAWLLEQGLRQLFNDQIEYFESDKNCDKSSYQALQSIMSKEFVNFDINKATLGYVVKLYHVTRFFDLLQNRLDVRLTFTRKLPWKNIVKIRNTITHDNFVAKKEIAVDFIHYIKVFIYETGIDDRYDETHKSNKCHDCQVIVDSNWNYCSNCGADLSVKCKKCGAKLKQSWAICPECELPRVGIKLKDPITMYKHYCEAVWADGILTKEEKQFLDKKREELGITIDEAQAVERIYTPLEAIRFRDAVEATLVDGVIDDDERDFLRRKAVELGVSEIIANEIFNACLTIDAIEDLFAKNESKLIVMRNINVKHN